MRLNTFFLVATVCAAGFASLASCAPSGTTTTEGTGASNASTGTTNSGGGGGCSGFCQNGDVVSVTIAPLDPTIEVLNGVIPPATQFTATGITSKGDVVPVSGAWSFDRLDVAGIDSSGALTATGLLGGTGIVKFTLDALVATTTVTVKLHVTDDPENVDPTIKATFGAASDADPSMSLLYPYDKTVFPRGLAGPIVQWNGGGGADIYYVHATSPTFEFEGWRTVPPPSRYALPTTTVDVWKKLTDSNAGDVKLDVQRYDGAKAYLPVSETWTIAPANLAGTIYYWEVNSGDVVRLKPGDTAPESFIQKPAGVTCIACHSVSKNGSEIVTSFNGSASPWGTFEAATGASQFVYGTDPNDGANGSGFQAISPSGSHVIAGQERANPYLSLSLFNGGAELAQLNPGSGFPVQPAWAGDPTKVAFAVRTDGNWLDYNTSTLWVTNVDLMNPGFTNAHKIVNGDANRPTITYPTFSPDSKWIAFERATQSRSRGGLSDVWITNIDGNVQLPLDRANGTGSLQGAEASSTYEPTFMPVSAAGYFWLVVVGERQYGNTLTDTNPTSRHKQLWVTAIDANPVAGQDPSHPAFWLPGQQLDNNNMRGEWALSPCKQIGDSCSAGYDCCDGFCHDDGTGNFTCSDQMGGCSSNGEACVTAADCCDASASCDGGFCSSVPQ